MPSLDIDIDINTLQAGFGARRVRARFNSDIANAWAGGGTGSLVPPPAYPEYHKNWDADLRAYMYLNDFLAKEPGWLARYVTVATDCSKPPQAMTQTNPAPRRTRGTAMPANARKERAHAHRSGRGGAPPT